MQQKVNPLQQYYRQTKTYVTLPSGTSYYSPDVLEFTESGEVGIRAMTSSDEMILKNPDALLNGEAIRQMLMSCVVGLKNANELLTNDVDLLMIAIRLVSYGTEVSLDLKCPKCSHEGTYAGDLEYMVNTAGKLEPSYGVDLESGATVFVKPFTYSTGVKATRRTFEQEQATESLGENSTTAQKLEMMSKIYKSTQVLQYEMILSSIVKIVDEAHDLDFENNKINSPAINEMLHNIDVSEAKKINDVLTEINNIGIDKHLPVICENVECGHEWKTEVDLNPVDFFTGS